jgi:hypothetical protein
LPSEAQRLPTEVVEALENRAESDRLGTAARATALRRGDVAHRWAELAGAVGLAKSPGIQQRIDHLATLADQLST